MLAERTLALPPVQSSSVGADYLATEPAEVHEERPGSVIIGRGQRRGCQRVCIMNRSLICLIAKRQLTNACDRYVPLGSIWNSSQLNELITNIM